MSARAYFQGINGFNLGMRFRDNPYRRYSGRESELLAWYEGWSTGFDITWRKLTAAQRFEMEMPSKPSPLRPTKRLPTRRIRRPAVTRCQ